MDIPSFGQPVGVRAMLFFVFAGPVLTDTLHPLDRALRVHEQVGLRVLAAPASVGDNAHMLRRKDHYALAKRDATVVRHGISDRAQHLLRRIAAMVLDIAKAAGGEHRYARHPIWIALRFAKQWPGIATRALGDAETVFAGMPLRRLV